MCSQKQKFWPIPNGTKVPFFPNFEEKKNNPQIFFFFFFFEEWDLHSVNTHTSYMVTFTFNLMAILCVIAKLNLFFLLTKNDILCTTTNFPI